MRSAVSPGTRATLGTVRGGDHERSEWWGRAQRDGPGGDQPTLGDKKRKRMTSKSVWTF